VNNNLTSLANAKTWAQSQGSTTNDDALLTRLVGSASRFILSYLQRPTLFQNLYTDVYDGMDTEMQMLRHWPVLSVSSVVIGRQTIPALASPTTGYGCGYVLDPWDGFPPGKPQALTLRGHKFWRGYSNVSISYISGFVVQNEAQTVPSGSYQVTPYAPNGNFAVDQGVTYANGNPLNAVPSKPATGQYVAPVNGSPYYQFAAGDANAAVLLSYSYVPADIEDACINMVGERYSYRSRIGTVSKSLGGQETMAYSQKDMPDYIRTMLQPYRRVLPV
jgi:hypothetical protein